MGVRICRPLDAGPALGCTRVHGQVPTYLIVVPISLAGKQVPRYQVAILVCCGTDQDLHPLALTLGSHCTTTYLEGDLDTDLAFTSPFANGNSNPTAQLTRLWNHRTHIALPETASPPTPQ